MSEKKSKGLTVDLKFDIAKFAEAVGKLGVCSKEASEAMNKLGIVMANSPFYTSRIFRDYEQVSLIEQAKIFNKEMRLKGGEESKPKKAGKSFQKITPLKKV